jgi:hypothetical protein
MANNYGPLPQSGPISLEDIADVFFLYKSYPDLIQGRLVDMTDYYGDKIEYYTPLQPPIPVEASKTLRISDFRGKRYGLLVDLVINAPVNNYNLYDQAQARINVLYPGFILSSAAIPYFITLTNNASVGSVSVDLPALSIGTSSNNVNASINKHSTIAFINNGSVVGATAPGGPRTNTYNPVVTSWTIPRGVTSVSVRVVGGGGGGGTGMEQGWGGGGGGGGSGGTSAGTISVSTGGVMSIRVGGGGGGGQTNGSNNVVNGSAGGSTTISYGTTSITGGGGSGGGGGNEGWGGFGGNAGWPNGNRGGEGKSGSNGSDSGSGGNGGASVYGVYGRGGNGGRFDDRSGQGWSGDNGVNGVAVLEYVINIPGGPAVHLTRPATIINSSLPAGPGLLAGGVSSIGSAGERGAYITGYSNVINKPVGGNTTGSVQG